MMASKVTLRSNDGEEFVMDETTAMLSVTLKHMSQDGCGRDVITVANVDAKTLSKIIDYVAKHAAAASSSSFEGIEKWDKEFINVDMNTLYVITMGAHFLEISGLLDLCVQKVAGMIKGKSVDEIRRTFNITNDFTPEEEQRIRAEHAWAYEDN